jgi:toxin ParE1/3/4
VLRIRPQARDDLEAAARWYEAQQKGLGRHFLAEVRRAFQRIRLNPEAYPAPYRGTRRALIRRFPYSVIFLSAPEHKALLCWRCCIVAATPGSGAALP